MLAWSIGREFVISSFSLFFFHFLFSVLIAFIKREFQKGVEFSIARRRDLSDFEIYIDSWGGVLLLWFF